MAHISKSINQTTKLRTPAEPEVGLEVASNQNYFMIL